VQFNKLFAKTPKGKNSIKSSMQLYNEKNFYYNNVYPDGDLPWLEKPFDFINENPLYGKVNLNGDYIIPKHALIGGTIQYERIIAVDTESYGAKAFDFVADAFNDLRFNIRALVKLGQLSPTGPIAKFEAKKGFIDFGIVDKLQKDIHYFMFVSSFLSRPSVLDNRHKYKELLHNSSDFTKFFLLYLKHFAKEAPFTKGSIINSFYMSPRATGLCLEIDDTPYDDDQKKHAFITSPNFNIYRILARRYGFMVDRNVPWRLVADVRSFKMREYMRLAYERKTILERQNKIIKEATEESQYVFQELPELEDLYVLDNTGTYIINTEYLSGIYKKDTKSINEFANEIKNKLAAVLNTVADETKDFMTNTYLYMAKDPTKNNEGVNTCLNKGSFNICMSRIFRFNKFFEVYYDVPYSDEIKDIKKTFYNNYLSYYIQNPKTKKKVICSDNKTLQTKFVVQEIDLEIINENQYNSLYSNYFWIKAYFDIKLVENNIKLKPSAYNTHLKKLMELATLTVGSENNSSGTTSKDANHTHEYNIDADGNGKATMTVHPTNPNIKHEHKITNWVVQSAQSECYPSCAEGAPPHVHEINNNISLALSYANKLIKKNIKGLKQVYGDKGEKKEQSIGLMLTAPQIKGIISSLKLI